MPLFYTKEISPTTKLAIWKIEEPESFFLSYVPLSSEISHPHKRLQHLAGRYLLQYLFPNFPIHSIQIASTRKPFLENERYHFSISHCGDYAAAIVSSTHRIGIDIELQRPTVAKIAAKFLHEEEINDTLLQDITSLTILWSTKEAIFKWWGLGDVDFSEMIRIDKYKIEAEGTMEARFLQPTTVYSFYPQYKVFGNLCLVWVIG